ncbi:hypothetical protein C2E23DRAFT_913554 [Lenzites betulinus]|nr:hypothetical protein C2E23DRAFT_913554 [Lenzites betulinus]
MKLYIAILFAAALAVSVSSRAVSGRDASPDLVPQFGVTAGVNPDGTVTRDASIIGAVDKLIPKDDSPSPPVPTDVTLQNLIAVGKPPLIPKDDSPSPPVPTGDLVTLQNLVAVGKACERCLIGDTLRSHGWMNANIAEAW